MNYPLRNLIYEKIKQVGNMTDSELIKNLSKDGVQITTAELDKTLLALEIF
ncbi:MAG TPA: hypothetical protein VJR67_04325 [Candidatus Nitrosopolaris sp.]|nr:hypothetical protein [Candidatus Nitrosopolaris sp.]